MWGGGRGEGSQLTWDGKYYSMKGLGLVTGEGGLLFIGGGWGQVMRDCCAAGASGCVS